MRQVVGLGLWLIGGSLAIGCALSREKRQDVGADHEGWVRLCRLSIDSRRGALFHQRSGAYIELESASTREANAPEPLGGDEVTRGSQGNVPFVAIRAKDARGRAQRGYGRDVGWVPEERPDGPPFLPPAGCAFEGVTFSPMGHVLNVSASVCDQAQERATRALVFSDEFLRDAPWIEKECARRGVQWSDVAALDRETPLATAIQRLGQPGEVWRAGKSSVTLAYQLSEGGGAQLTFAPSGLLGATRTK